MTRNNQRLGSAFDDVDPRLSFLCQVGDDVTRPWKICRGCQINSFVDRPIQSRLQSVLGDRSFYVERNRVTKVKRLLKLPEANDWNSAVFVTVCFLYLLGFFISSVKMLS